jgi:hypothetical protein
MYASPSHDSSLLFTFVRNLLSSLYASRAFAFSAARFFSSVFNSAPIAAFFSLSFSSRF